ncbi:hypothetical protein CEE45_14350 [Candidatus Heimdallarchaeota archaeon B3_Heim]|nr:MAG: hypothetical protein CEE45_14350 [Candidatus Heimdallarchaeota archaeon B3_Heim]
MIAQLTQHLKLMLLIESTLYKSFRKFKNSKKQKFQKVKNKFHKRSTKEKWCIPNLLVSNNNVQ